MNKRYIKEKMKLFSGCAGRPLFGLILASIVLFVIVFTISHDNEFENKFTMPSQQFIKNCVENFFNNIKCFILTFIRLLG